jgi:hypothetical protein
MTESIKLEFFFVLSNHHIVFDFFVSFEKGNTPKGNLFFYINLKSCKPIFFIRWSIIITLDSYTLGDMTYVDFIFDYVIFTFDICLIAQNLRLNLRYQSFSYESYHNIITLVHYWRTYIPHHPFVLHNSDSHSLLKELSSGFWV